ncbi:MAG: rRNA pseudouridine synthase, partial [Oscillospiraceae bacterium]|nr:rRNA pseudouridine synthase [Oscillospiraceae bacterium]
MRLDKLLRERGIASRTETKQLIADGRVTVNGIVAESHSMLCSETDVIAVDGKTVAVAVPVYLMLHKPAGCVTATSDETEQTVMDLLPEAYREMALFPVGRLDKESEGLLLLTNDGSFCTRVIEPEHHVPKTYYIEVGRAFASDTEEKFAEGITFPNGTVCRPGQIEIGDDTKLMFCEGVILRREASVSGINGNAFINKGAIRGEYNRNIEIVGLHLECNGIESNDFGVNSRIA